MTAAVSDLASGARNRVRYLLAKIRSVTGRMHFSCDLWSEGAVAVFVGVLHFIHDGEAPRRF